MPPTDHSTATARVLLCLRASSRVFAVCAGFLAAASAHAERGALSLDLSAGAAVLNLAAPYSSSSGTVLAPDFEAMLGLRYAVTNEFEFTLAGYFEPSLSYTHDDAFVLFPDSSTALGGAVSHSLSTVGVVGGLRYVHGLVWKLVLGLEAGWNRRVYSNISFNNTSLNGNYPLDHFNTDNIVLQPLIGVEWAFADHWSASLLPRFTVLIGPDATVGFSLMLSISYSWFL